MSTQHAEPDATLQRLLHPTSIDDFVASIWESRYLHVSRDHNPDLGHYLTSLASIDTVDELLTITYAAGPRPFDSVRLGREGVMISPEEYLSGSSGSIAQVDVARVLSLYRSGASLILNRVHDANWEISHLCEQLSAFFGVGVHANAYITPAGAQGFPLHSDSHDVFLLQVDGCKDWTIYTPQEAELVRKPCIPVDGCPPPASAEARLRLQAGEVLYMPRGLLHQGIAGDCASFHLTIGLEPYTWSDLIRDVLPDLEQDDAELRRSVAPRLAMLDKDDERFTRTVAILSSRLLDRDRLRRAAHRKANGARRPAFRPLRGHLSKMFHVSDISSTTRVQVGCYSDPSIDRAGDSIILRFANKALTLPSFTEPHLRVLCRGKPVCAADLPPSLDSNSRLILVRRLVLEGLLEVLS